MFSAAHRNSGRPLRRRILAACAIILACPFSLALSPGSEPADRAPWLDSLPRSPAWWRSHAPESLLSHLLSSVPEIQLPELNPAAKSPEEASLSIDLFVKTIVKEYGTQEDGFHKDLSKRKEFAGLPFLLGKEHRLTKEQLLTREERSLGIRMGLDRGARTLGQGIGQPASTAVPGAAHQFWLAISQGSLTVPLRPTDSKRETERKPSTGEWQSDEAIPSLVQILETQHADFRLGLVHHLAQAQNAHATGAVARRAVFDPDPDVRAAAMDALCDRPPADYESVLLEALRHPWPWAASHAAHALAKAQRKGVVPKLIDLLDEPDPSAPFEKMVDGRKTLWVRELVRINHHRNCLVCHAPSTDENDLLRAVIPVPGAPLPPLASVAYYDRATPGPRIRADVTYLKQDFSALLEVAASGSWPAQQRFDFVVRTRPLSDQETQQYLARPKDPPQAISEHRAAVVLALRRLTGLDGGTTAAAWRQALYFADRPLPAYPFPSRCWK